MYFIVSSKPQQHFCSYIHTYGFIHIRIISYIYIDLYRGYRGFDRKKVDFIDRLDSRRLYRFYSSEDFTGSKVLKTLRVL